MGEMFCFQCEQTGGGHGCTGKQGVCGKPADTANLQDVLTGAMIALANVAGGKATPATDRALMEGLFTTVTNVDFDSAAVQRQIDAVHAEGAKFGAGPDYDMEKVWNGNEDIRSLKSLLLFGMRGMAAYAFHALVLGYTDPAVSGFLYKGLAAVGNDDWGMDELLPLVMECGKANLACMELLDKANTETYGTPAPTTVPLTIEKGPFIVITGHDLHDLELLLKQTEGKGVNVYTHGEMLPCHAYPKLKAYPHLKGNFGTAWQSQQKEFDGIPAPILYTTNCLMPPKDSYRDRIFTTEVVAYPGMVHIGADKDFTPVIAKALELGGYAEFVKQTPDDTVVLTLACGKFRFNDLDIGEIGGLPRIMDMGQCNDAYSAIKVAGALAEAFGTDVNGLPLTLVLSWYEQKAVVILLSLLALGIRNIRLGPTLPAFVSPNVLNYLVENFALTPISTPEEDLAKILA